MTFREHRIEVTEPGRVPLVLVVADRLPLGRAGDGLLLADERISRRHCELQVQAGALVVRDGGSSNGTFVNGRRLRGSAPLAPGDVVELGDIVVRVQARPVEGLSPDVSGPAGTDTVPATVGRSPAVDAAIAAANQSGDLSASLAVVADEVHRTGVPDLAASVVGDTITMVFSDIEGSTALNAEMGDRAWYSVLKRHNQVIRHQRSRYGGTEVKGQGDGFMLTFPSARHALLFAISVQRELGQARHDDPSFPVRVRIGVHTGEVIHAGGDIFGWHVNFAARVAALGAGEEVVVSRLAFDLVSAMGDLSFGAPRQVDLKGFGGTHTVYPLDWR